LVLQGCSTASEQDFIESAQKYMAQKDNDAAIIELKSGVSEYPQSAELRELLANAHLSAGVPVSAIKEYEKVIELRGPDIRIVSTLLPLLHIQESSEKIIEYTDSFLEQFPSDISMLAYYRGVAKYRLSKPSEAKAVFQLAFDKTDHFAMMSKMYNDMIINNRSASLQELEEILEVNGQFQDALLQKAVLLANSGKWRESKLVLNRLREFKVRTALVDFLYVEVAVKLNELNNAKMGLEQLQKYNNFPIYKELASIVEFESKNFVNAARLSAEAIDGEINTGRVLIVSGFSNFYLGKFDSALSALERIRPNAAEYLQANRLMEEIESIRNGNIPFDVNDNELLSRKIDLGFELASNGSPLLATKIIEETKNIDPSILDSRNQLKLLILKSQFGEDDIDLTSLASFENESNSQYWFEALDVALQNNQLNLAFSLFEEDFSNKRTIEVIAYPSIFNKYEKVPELIEYLVNRETAADSTILYNSVLSRAYLLIDDFDSSLQYVLAAIDSAPNNIELLYAALDLLKQNVAVDKMEALIKRAFKANSEKIRFITMYAEALQFKQQYSESRDVLAKFTMKDRANNKYWDLLVDSYAYEKNFSEADKVVTNWIAKKDNINAWQKKLFLLDVQGKYTDAYKTVELLEQKFGTSEALIIKKIYFAISGNLDVDIVDSYYYLPRRVKDSELGQSLFNQIMAHTANVDDGLDYLLSEYKRSPTAKTVALIITQFKKNGSPLLLAEFLEQHLLKAPDDFVSRLYLSDLYLINLKSTESALPHLKALYNRQPKNLMVLNNYAWALGETNDVKQAVTIAEPLLNDKRTNVDYLDTYVTLHLKLQSTGKAMLALEKIYELKPTVQNLTNYIVHLSETDKTAATNLMELKAEELGDNYKDVKQRIQ
jgi:tetratricopeptide (TPR) repeat protein